MARPARLRLLEERPVPERPEDVAVIATEVAQAPVQIERLSSGDADAIISELKSQVALAQTSAAEARKGQQDAEQTVQAIREAALKKIAETEQQAAAARQEAVAAAQASVAKTDERKQSVAVATAVSLGLMRQIAAELVKIFAWFPALGALLGGFWLFDRSLIEPSPQTLIALALYGLVVVAPASLLTLRSRVT